MTSTKVKGIVIGAKDYKEKDKLITIFSFEEGIIFSVLKGVKNPNAKFKMAKEPFCFAEFVLEGMGDYKTVTSVNIIDSFFELAKDFEIFSVASAIISALPCVLVKNQRNEKLFVNTIKAFSSLAIDKVKPELVLSHFLLHLFLSCGVGIEFSKCNSCGGMFLVKKYLSLDSAEFLCGACANENCLPIDEQTFSALVILQKNESDKLRTIKFSDDLISVVLHLILKIFEIRFSRRINLIK